MNKQDRNQIEELKNTIESSLRSLDEDREEGRVARHGEVIDHLERINGTLINHGERISHIEGARESEGRFANITPGRAAAGGAGTVTAVGAIVYGITKLVELWPA